MKVNPQALAAVSQRSAFNGDRRLAHPSLESVDPDTWLTPRYILAELGRFDLDPCAAALNPTWVTEKHYTVADDGLRRAWSGRVFMNPPFSNTVPWIRRHAEHGAGISLVPAAVESRVWREYVWPKATGVLLLHGRTRFCNPDGSSTTGRPLRSISLIAWSRPDLERLKLSSLAGVLLSEWRQL